MSVVIMFLFICRLKFIFGPTALYALDLVDQRSVTQVTSPSGRSTFQVSVGIFQFPSNILKCLVPNLETLSGGVLVRI